MTRREQSLHLFHLLGKIMYNKREYLDPGVFKPLIEIFLNSGKGDPPNPSASAKDKKREQELDSRLRNPPPLPSWLSDHKRATSRVDVDVCLKPSIFVAFFSYMRISGPLHRLPRRYKSLLALHSPKLHAILRFRRRVQFVVRLAELDR